MALTVHVASLQPDPHGPPPVVTSGAPELRLKTPYFSDTIYFPDTGLVRSYNFSKVPGTAVFDLGGRVQVGNEGLDFSYGDLGGNDTMFVWAVGAFRFIANVWHARRRGTRVPYCVARCADGSSAPVCVICRSGPIE